MKFYAVAKGRKPGIYLTWDECKKQVDGFGGSKFKSFSTQIEAEDYYKQHNDGHLPKNQRYANIQYQETQSANQKYKYIDTCLLCEKPFKQQRGKNDIRKASGLCKECKARQHKLRSSLKHATNGQIGWLSANELIWVKINYQCKSVFSFAIKKPEVAFRAKECADSGLVQRELLKRRKKTYAVTDEAFTPIYLKKLLGESKEFIRISGDKRDPCITYHCKKCDKDFTAKYRNLLKHTGHDCAALVSSGEGIVRDYLNKLGIAYRTQRDTLKCVNPDTGYIMPYDFEIPSLKIVVEVQGEQHRMFIERFHVDMEGFKYQQQRDAYKKKFAEECGYRVVEIWYSDFKTGRYKAVLNEALNTPPNQG